MVVVDSFGLKPFWKEREVLVYLLSIENSVDHMATEQSHFYFVSHMAVDILIFVDVLKNVRCRWTIWKLQLIENFLRHWWFVSFLEVFYWHVAQYSVDLIECIIVHYVSLHVLFFKFWKIFRILWRFCTLDPSFWINVCVFQWIWHFIVA